MVVVDAVELVVVHAVGLVVVHAVGLIVAVVYGLAGIGFAEQVVGGALVVEDGTVCC